MTVGALNQIKTRLTNKLGPLPVWAWAAITGAAIYVYRVRKGTAAALVDNTGIPTDTTTAATPRDPVTLQPGEQVYDPNTGQLVGAGPGQAGATGTTSPLVPLGPGTYYDPTTGNTVTVPADSGTTNPTGAGTATKPKPKSALAKAKARVALGRGGSAKSKHPTKTIAMLLKAGYSRGQISHAQSKHTALGKPRGKRQQKPKTKVRAKVAQAMAGGRTRARSSATVKTQARAVTANTGASRGRPRGTAPSRPTQARGRAHVQSPPQMRQRPAAPRHTDHTDQRTKPHPARAAKRKR